MKRQTIFSILITLCFMAIFPISTHAYELWDGVVDTEWYDPYEVSYTISTAGELVGLAQLVNGGNSFFGKTITLRNDLLLVKASDGNSIAWEAIGAEATPFEGTFDGAGKMISHLSISLPGTDYQGLFGYVGSSGTVKNLSVQGNITGNNYVGGIVGYTDGDIINCNFSSYLAYNYRSSVTGKENEPVYGLSGVGGVAGYVSSTGSVINCHNDSVRVSSDDLLYSYEKNNAAIGGVVGTNAGIVANCYNSGNVAGNGLSPFLGGIVGDNNGGTVANSYNVGTISHDGSSVRIGGVAGANYSAAGTITNCYYLTGKGASTGVGVHNDNNYTNIGTFSSADSEITLDTTITNNTATDSISKTGLLTALSDGTVAYNGTNPTNKAYGWKIASGNSYPVHLTNWADYQTEPVDGKISSATDLAWFVNKESPSGNYTLTQDIDLSAHEWTPIGNYYYRFTGTFDGAGHEITGMYINTVHAYNGLFGSISSTATVKNVSVSGEITDGFSVGGVVGYSYGDVINCSSNVTLSGTSYAGGVVGYADEGSVVNCYNTGAVSSTNNSSNVGGVVGRSGVNIVNCYNTGTVSSTGSGAIGGVVGNSASGSVVNSYNTGAISATGYNSSVGGVVGAAYTRVTNCYYQANKGVDVSIGYTASGFVGSNIGSFSGMDTMITIERSANSAIPTTNIVSALNAGAAAYNTANPDTEQAKPWMHAPEEEGGHPIYATYWVDYAEAPTGNTIRTAAELAWLINNHSDGTYTLADDINLSGRVWQPIGDEGNKFTGTFNGADHEITGLYVNAAADHQGLFGYIENASITNVGVQGSVTGNNYVGGFVGRSNQSSVSNSYSGCTVTGVNYVGGLAGQGSVTHFTDCYNTGAVTGNNYTGGVTGSSSNATISGCYNTGAVIGNNSVGGVIGTVGTGTLSGNHNSGTVKGEQKVGGLAGVGSAINIADVNNTAAVEGDLYVGGLVGELNDKSTLSGSYNGGAVSANSYVGGLVGNNHSGNTINNCYNTNKVNSITYATGSTVGGIAGGNSGTVINCHNTGNVTSVGRESYTGGLVGSNYATVANSYNTATVNNTNINSDVGGLVGYTYGGAITNCYNTGSVLDEYDSNNTGGLAGRVFISTIKNSYFLSDGNATLGNLFNSTFENIGSFTDASSSIVLIPLGTDDNGIPEYDLVSALNAGAEQYNTVNSGTKALLWMPDITENGSYPVWATNWVDFASAEEPEGGLITTPEQLAWLINNHSTGIYTLGKDIDLSGHVWAPIGNTANKFSGTFDGANYKITGLFLGASTQNNQGLFGYVGTDGIVKDVSVYGKVTGNNNVGGLVGENWGTVSGSSSGAVVRGNFIVGGVAGENSGSIMDCDSDATVTGNTNVGGVAGETTDYSILKGCSNTGDVMLIEKGRAGGVVGLANEGVSDCYNSGTVSGSADGVILGGVVGVIDGGSRLTNCYNTGELFANGAQAIVGGVAGNTKGTTFNSYNTGTISIQGDESHTGGVVGENEGFLNNSYNTGTISVQGDESRVGGLVGVNTGNILNSYNTGNITITDTFVLGYLGGVAGINVGSSGEYITNCYNIGELSSTGSDSEYVGGVTARNEAEITNSYYLTGKGADAAVFDNQQGIISNVGSFSTAGSQITLDANIENPAGIPHTNLLTALNAAADAYNVDVTDDILKFYRWQRTSQESYPSHTNKPPFGDVNEDLIVDEADLNAIAAAAVYNKAVTSATEKLDVNGDGTINFLDLAMVRNSKNFGE